MATFGKRKEKPSDKEKKLNAIMVDIGTYRKTKTFLSRDVKALEIRKEELQIILNQLASQISGKQSKLVKGKKDFETEVMRRKKLLNKEESLVKEIKMELDILLNDNKGKQASLNEALEHYKKSSKTLREEKKSIAGVRNKLILELSSIKKRQEEYDKLYSTLGKKKFQGEERVKRREAELAESQKSLKTKVENVEQLQSGLKVRESDLKKDKANLEKIRSILNGDIKVQDTSARKLEQKHIKISALKKSWGNKNAALNSREKSLGLWNQELELKLKEIRRLVRIHKLKAIE